VSAQVNPDDDLLQVYKITDAQMAAFSTSDGVISPFWASDWDSRDYIDMNTTNNSYPGRDAWDGSDDANITIKAAASSDGLYFYALVTDNVWVDATGGENAWASDAVDLYFDSKSSTEIASGGEEIMVNPAYGWALTYTSQQMQVWMGASALPTAFMFNYYDDLYWTWSYNNTTFANAALLYGGMTMEVVSVDATSKAQEWFIPWGFVGTGGIAEVAEGTQIGFTGGYNDLDGDGGEVNCLRWKNYDPFSSANGLTSWGNLVISEAIPVGTVSPVANRVIDNGSIATKALYTLNGEKLAAKDVAMVRNHAMVVERTVLSSGKVVSRMIRAGR
jgi:hypothetical protein